MASCVYCLAEPPLLTKDHVPPKSWIPSDCPDTRITVPACPSCNAEIGHIEKRLLVKLGVCMPGGDSGGDHLQRRALRSLDPGAAKSARDRRARLAERRRILEERRIFEPDRLPLLHGFGPEDHGRSSEGLTTLDVCGDDIAAFARKVVRAVVFVRCDRTLLATDLAIYVYNPSTPEAARYFSLAKRCDSFVVGPLHVGFKADGARGLFGIELWNRLRILALYDGENQ